MCRHLSIRKTFKNPAIPGLPLYRIHVLPPRPPCAADAIRRAHGLRFSAGTAPHLLSTLARLPKLDEAGCSANFSQPPVMHKPVWPKLHQCSAVWSWLHHRHSTPWLLTKAIYLVWVLIPCARHSLICVFCLSSVGRSFPGVRVLCFGFVRSCWLPGNCTGDFCTAAKRLASDGWGVTCHSRRARRA